MELQSLIYLFVSISFTIYFSIALWTKASSTKDFYIVKDLNHPSLNGISIAIDFISAATFLSFAGLFLYSYSIVNYFIFGVIFGFLLLSFLIVPKLRKEAEFSIPTYFNKKYKSPILTNLTAIIVLLITFLYLNAQLKASGIILSRIFQITFDKALFIALFIALFYASVSGRRNISYAFIFQYIIVFISIATPIIFLTLNLTNSYFPQLLIFSSLENNQEFLVAIKDSFLEFNIIEENSLINNILLAITVAFGVATLPHILIKFFVTSNIENSKKSALWGLFFVTIIYSFIVSLPGLSAINFSKNISNTNYETYIQDNYIDENSIHKNGKWLKTWEDTSLVLFKDLNNDKNIALNELDFNPDTIFLINSEIANMPNWIIALVISGALAATLSTMTALIILLKSTLANEFIFKDKKPNKFILNFLLAIIIIFATFFNFKDFTILKIVILSFSISAATIFPILFLTMFKKIDKNSIYYALLISLILIISYTFIYDYFNFFIRPEAIGVIIGVLSILISFFCSKFIFNKRV
ncbi:sodium:solute symporter family transporter [Aliarcobacter thereius]|uniref:Cation/acetate symporter ActP n=1 Tax=Aliarcobacter thereius LMG 24486 TaxID=1032240 RepID=A0A1C7WPI3_9BACT|nr:hypothetical protein [Aliarcobacter thereius]OCL92267.1 Cation/acetate symporter ActP [Aliarcobacter thereius]OCL94637.1 Cation/acetate symporter ActP [Aliarcobacter thereius LMG 24486]QBF15487.1 cation:acetate symporter [Aliarcobacter thereius LMG 24486]TLS93299.1 hypothetical protein FE244_04905 [Aliarcobacter thereius]